jgi:hypothetical protein
MAGIIPAAAPNVGGMIVNENLANVMPNFRPFNGLLLSNIP